MSEGRWVWVFVLGFTVANLLEDAFRSIGIDHPPSSVSVAWHVLTVVVALYFLNRHAREEAG